MLISLFAGFPASAQEPVVLEMLLEKTIFNVDAARVRVEFGEESSEKLRELKRKHDSAEELERPLAQVASSAKNATIQMTFLRDVGFERFVSEIKDGVECAFESEMTSEEELNRVMEGVEKWFSSVKERGIREGDQLIYHAHPRKIRTVLKSKDGKTLVEQVDEGKAARVTLLASYFAPCSDFREGLAESLLDDNL